MADQSIDCPKCGTSIQLTEALTSQVKESVRSEFEAREKAKVESLEADHKEELAVVKKDVAASAKKQATEEVSTELADLKEQIQERTNQLNESRKKELDLRKRERKLEDKEKTLELNVESLEADYKEKLAAVKKNAAASAKKQATEEVSTELADLKEQVQERTKLLDESRKKELGLLKKQRQLEDKEKALELDVARKLSEQREEIEEVVGKRLQGEHHLKDLEKDKQLTDTKRQVAELKRRLEQGSQQTQGEVVEIELEQALTTAFPFDQIEPVPKGIRGADVLQRVHTKAGHCCGAIVWESKNTKNWSDAWLGKLRDDQRKVKAEVAVIVSAVLPKTVNLMGMIDGVWVVDFSIAIALATSLRESICQVADARLATVGKNEKMEVMYTYLSGTEFRQRVEGMVESFISMRNDLDRERRAMERAWAKREKQIQSVVGSVAGMYGDMQGIIGTSLPKIERLELPTPDA